MINIIDEKSKAYSGLTEYAKKIIDYRRTGISLNHIIGCPINCAYCVRHFWGNFDMKKPHMLCSDEEAVRKLLESKFFIPDVIPIQFLHKATDPFLPDVKEHTFNVLKLLDEKKVKNIVMLITRLEITKEDLDFLESLHNVRVCVFFTYSGIKDPKIEPAAKFEYVKKLISVLQTYERKRVHIVQYWRPIVNGWNDDDETIEEVFSLSKYFDAIVIKGLRHKKENDTYFKKQGIKINHEYGQYEKVLTSSSLERIKVLYKKCQITTPIFYKTSCAISYCEKSCDYNLQFKTQRTCMNCPKEQQEICRQGIQGGALEKLCKILNKEIQEISESEVYITDSTKEERLFAMHYLQKTIKEENK